MQQVLRQARNWCAKAEGAKQAVLGLALEAEDEFWAGVHFLGKSASQEVDVFRWELLLTARMCAHAAVLKTRWI